MSDAGGGPDDPEVGGEVGGEVGSVGEEAAKLLGALGEWAKDQGSDTVVPGLAGLAGVVSGLGEHVAAGIDTGAEECAYCPICRTVHVLRTTSPEVREHLISAATSLVQAAAGFLATLPPPGGDAARESGFEKIDLDEPDDEPDDEPLPDPDGDL